MRGKTKLATVALTAFVTALMLPSGCGGSSDSGLYAGSGAKSGSGGVAGTTGGTSGQGGAAGVAQVGGGAGIAGNGGSAATDAAASVDASLDSEVDATTSDTGPDGNNPFACPPLMPQPGSACNIFVNNTDCIYGFKHCVCTISTWLCVP